MVPITFKEVIPLDAIHKNNKNTAKVNNWAVIGFISFIKLPSCFTVHPNAIKAACGFWAKYGIWTTQ